MIANNFLGEIYISLANRVHKSKTRSAVSIYVSDFCFWPNPVVQAQIAGRQDRKFADCCDDRIRPKADIVKSLLAALECLEKP